MKNKLIKVVSSVLLCQFILVACGNTKTTETDIDESEHTLAASLTSGNTYYLYNLVELLVRICI